MKELTIEHLAAYLPYGVRCVYQTGNGMGEHASVIESIDMSRPYSFGSAFWPMNDLKKCKLILRPLSDLTREITQNGETFVPTEWFEIGDDNNESIDYGKGNVWLIKLLKDMAKHNFIELPYMNYGVVRKLHEWHFDTFRLIESGLAIDINTLPK